MASTSTCSSRIPAFSWRSRRLCPRHHHRRDPASQWLHRRLCPPRRSPPQALRHHPQAQHRLLRRCRSNRRSHPELPRRRQVPQGRERPLLRCPPGRQCRHRPRPRSGSARRPWHRLVRMRLCLRRPLPLEHPLSRARDRPHVAPPCRAPLPPVLQCRAPVPPTPRPLPLKAPQRYRGSLWPRQSRGPRRRRRARLLVNRPSRRPPVLRKSSPWMRD